MIPLRDNVPARTLPVVNYAMIGACTVVFLVQLAQPDLVERLGMIPQRVFSPGKEIVVREVVGVVSTPYGLAAKEVERVLAPSAVPPWLTLLTCVFLHGGWLHFLGNMWFLYIFGDNVEDRFGHVGYFFFYLASGVGASAAHLVTSAGSEIPTIGASGAIAGVMGSYLLLYPHARVQALIPIVYIMQIVVLPAPLFLGFWFVLQFFQGVMSIGSTESGGVAWWAHIGGFALGMAAVGVLKVTGLLQPPVTTVRPKTDHTTMYRAYPRRGGW